mmetsp:Transcript_4151/g.7616  ORF Transcript_4151/g.7616 Transcript_4151/m.7616 type:complete len:90 (+) Transcript_4151:493-762(+)
MLLHKLEVRGGGFPLPGFTVASAHKEEGSFWQSTDMYSSKSDESFMAGNSDESAITKASKPLLFVLPVIKFGGILAIKPCGFKVVHSRA